jgi:hypothetical protein
VASLVIVGQRDYVAALQECRVRSSPFTCSSGVAGRDHAPFGELLYEAFALDDEYRMVGRDRL